ncbi:hypothetical protein BH11ARM1_BH11ARM1_03010 [soil metagenome]
MQLMLALLAISIMQSPSLTGNIERIPAFESKILGNKRNLIVYLPPDYATNIGKRYPVMYLNDGQNVFDGATSFIRGQEWQLDETAERLIKAGVIPPLIMVGIDNAGGDRANEYLPTKVKDNGGNADNYGRMLITEIMPMINAKYRTLKGPTNTGLGGSSFGGIVSLHLGLTRPDVFGRLAVMSPSVWWDNREILKEIKQKSPSKIWLDIGSKEGYDSEKNARDLKYALMDKGWKVGTDLQYMVGVGDSHNEIAWAKRSPQMLTFLWGKPDKK